MHHNRHPSTAEEEGTIRGKCDEQHHDEEKLKETETEREKNGRTTKNSAARPHQHWTEQAILLHKTNAVPPKHIRGKKSS